MEYFIGFNLTDSQVDQAAESLGLRPFGNLFVDNNNVLYRHCWQDSIVSLDVRSNDVQEDFIEQVELTCPICNEKVTISIDEEKNLAELNCPNRLLTYHPLLLTKVPWESVDLLRKRLKIIMSQLRESYILSLFYPNYRCCSTRLQ